MSQPRAHEGSRIVVLAGPGLDRASGIPLVVGVEDGNWQGVPLGTIGTAERWAADPEFVMRFYDEQRIACAQVLPNDGHESLARLQHVLGPRRCMLVSQSVRGLLIKAAAHEVIEMRGSLYRLRCEAVAEHPRVGVFGAQNRSSSCAVCGATLRPDIQWPGEPLQHLDVIHEALDHCDFFMAVGTKGYREPALSMVSRARAAGARCIEVNPNPHDEPSPFDTVIAKPAEQALPEVFGDWLGDEVSG